MHKLLFYLFILSIYSINSPAQSNCRGEIVNVKGSGLLIENKKETKITSKNFKKIKLKSGQILKVLNKDAEIKIKLDCVNGEFSIVFDKPYQVPGKPELTSGPSLSPKKWKDGGGYRTGDDGIILFPIESNEIEDVVRPETAMIRWATSYPDKFTVTLIIQSVEDDNKILWSQKDIPGELGAYTDGELQKNLQDFRDTQPEEKLKLILKTDVGTENTTIFRIFSKSEEVLLKKELENISENNRIERAEIYYRFKLYTEAANECEKALKLLPDNIDLLKITSITQSSAGNLKRSNEINDRIKSILKKKKAYQ